jgi:hypothetical protein
MHLHHIEHVILEWTAKKLGFYLLGELLSAIKTAFFESSLWRSVTASILVLTFPVERMVGILRTVTVILLVGGMIGTTVYIVRRGARLPAAC